MNSPEYPSIVKLASIIAFLILLFPSFQLRGEERVDTVGIVKNARNALVVNEDGKIRIYCDYTGEDGKETFFYYSALRNEKDGIKLEPSAIASQEKADTLLSLPRANEMVVTRPDETRVGIDTREGTIWQSYFFDLPERLADPFLPEIKIDADNPFEKIHSFFCFPTSNPSIYWTIGINGFCVGLSASHGITGQPEFKWKKSFEIGWISIFQGSFHFGRSSLSLGAGLDWRNFRTEAEDLGLSVDKEGNVGYGKYPAGSSRTYSRIKIFSLQFPLLYRYRIPHCNLSLSVGPILNYNVHASVLSSYQDSDANKHQVLYKFDRQQPVTVDIFGNISFYGLIGVYVRYEPQRLLKSVSPLNFHPFTIGLSLCL